MRNMISSTLKGDLAFRRRETITWLVSNNGMIKIRSSTITLTGTELLSKSILIDIAESKKPKYNAPASPRYIEAGFLFQNRKPRQDAKIAKAKAATKYC